MINKVIDVASSKKISIFQKIKSYLYFQYHKVEFQTNTFSKRNFEIRKSKNAKIKLGKDCMIQENVFFLLTLPKPILIIGDNVSIGRSSIIAIKDHLNIGSNTEISANVFICDQSHGIEPGKLITDQKSIIEKVSIGNDVWIGTGSVILKGTTIGNGSVIGANSVVNKNVPDNEIWAGNPAKFIRKR
tara:strand:+ start:1250 stop:1810 length:561 start_codon:yes stop_codon:yes gene_type:complete